MLVQESDIIWASEPPGFGCRILDRMGDGATRLQLFGPQFISWYVVRSIPMTVGRVLGTSQLNTGSHVTGN